MSPFQRPNTANTRFCSNEMEKRKKREEKEKKKQKDHEEETSEHLE